jgi:hypothetical protein
LCGLGISGPLPLKRIADFRFVDEAAVADRVDSSLFTDALESGAHAPRHASQDLVALEDMMAERTDDVNEHHCRE